MRNKEKAMRRSTCLIIQLVALALFDLGMVAHAHADTTAAKRYMARGEAAMEMAKSPADFRDAVEEFSQAAKLAPGWANAWFNLGVAQEAAEDYRGAINSFKTYLKRTPSAADREVVEMRIFKLEYKIEKAGKRKEEGYQAKSNIDSLSGQWRQVSLWNTFNTVDGEPRRDGQKWFDMGQTALADVRVQGSNIKIKIHLAGATRIYSGSISGHRIEGYMSEQGTPCGARSNVSFEGEIWPKDRVILIIARGFCDGYGRLRNDNYRSSHLLRQ
jgi:tetratricopeptide (TPR) repeat protein